MIQQLKARFDAGDRAVSPVIGVILMVAITVILAAVIASMTLGLGDSIGNTAPTASFDMSASSSDDTVTLRQTGGDALHSENTRIVISIDGSPETFSPTGTDSTISVGQSATWTFSDDGAGASPAAAPSGDVWGEYKFDDPSTSAVDITDGSVVEIQIIDTDSQSIIYESEVTA